MLGRCEPLHVFDAGTINAQRFRDEVLGTYVKLLRGVMGPSTFLRTILLVSYRVLKIEVNKEKIRYILQFFFDKGGNASQVAEIVHSVYGADTVRANYVQVWIHRFRSGIFDVKGAPRTGRPIVENVDKITAIIDVDRHVRSHSIAQKLKIDHKTVLSHLCKVGF
ncbi:histone-lysine N-methyltransferase SETMAR [Trichonephila clavipes]|nr:histone-lysine N-methyltransferase SETMAR [Trichonephila clavipes]